MSDQSIEAQVNGLRQAALLIAKRTGKENAQWVYRAADTIERMNARLQLLATSAKKWEDAFTVQSEQLVKARDVEAIARAIYETEPHYESGEYVDGFAVSPGGNVSWDQAKARDAEFAADPIMGSITAFAYRAARAVVSLTDENGK